MATKQQENTEKRNVSIREEYEKMYSQRKFLSSYIFEVIGEKFFISPVTIMKIVFQQGHYKPKENEISKSEGSE